MDKYTGKKLDGRYEIRELIGVGGMAYVYHCYDTIDDREVAIKILKDEYLNNQDFIRRFKNESKAIAMLSHPNIVKVLDVSFGDMIQYIVMEYIDGITLKEYISLKEVLEWREALHLIVQTLKALNHAHENGIIHRDIKPQNIMLLQDGTIKVTDFGIARFSSNATRTMTQHAIGSVHYIAPEQAKGELTDGRADIYSIGVMLYEMLTGTVPFDSDNPVSVALMQLQNQPKRPRDINPSIPYGLEQITIKAMQKDKESRYQSALYMLTDIDRFRMNPSIVFSYKYFVDGAPTKHMTSSSTKRNDRVSPQKSKNYGDDYDTPSTQNKKSSPTSAEEDEDFPNKTKRYLSIIKASVISLVLAILVFGTLAIFKGCEQLEVKEVDVPNFIGMQLVEAQEENSKGDKFNFTYESDYDKSKEIGVVLKQDPEPGSIKVKVGSEIKLTINGTETTVKIPDIINQTEAEAVRILQAKNLTPEVIYVLDSKAAIGNVAAIFPAVGVDINVGGTVYLYVPKAADNGLVEIPNVEGLSYAAALEELKAKGFTNIEKSYDNESTKPKDEVLVQIPLFGGKVPKNYTIHLRLSNEKKIEREVTIPIAMPQNEEETVFMKVIVDGTQSEVLSTNVVPKYILSYNLKITGTETDTIITIELGGQQYRQYKVNFQTGQYTETFTGVYQPITHPPTEAPTEPPTELPIETENPEDQE